MSDEHGDGTSVVRAGLPPAEPGRPFLPGPVFAAPYHLDPVAGPQPGTPAHDRDVPFDVVVVSYPVLKSSLFSVASYRYLVIPSTSSQRH